MFLGFDGGLPLIEITTGSRVQVGDRSRCKTRQARWKSSGLWGPGTRLSRVDRVQQILARTRIIKRNVALALILGASGHASHRGGEARLGASSAEIGVKFGGLSVGRAGEEPNCQLANFRRFRKNAITSEDSEEKEKQVPMSPAVGGNNYAYHCSTWRSCLGLDVADVCSSDWKASRNNILQI